MLGATITALVVLVFEILIFKYHIAAYHRLRRLQATGIAVVGTIVDIQVETDSDGDNTYVPVIAYSTYMGENKLHKMSASSGNKKYTIGQGLGLVYDQYDPRMKPEVAPVRPMRVVFGVIIWSLVVLGFGLVIILQMLGIIQSSGGDDSATLLLPFCVVLPLFDRIKGLFARV